MRPSRAAGWAVVAGAALGAYSLYEPYRYHLARKEIPVRPGLPALSILHVSDLHLKVNDTLKRAFLDRLPEELGLVPDLVVATGDFIEDDAAMGTVVDCLSRLEARIGRYFVYGSHDYFRAQGPSYGKYFTREAPKKKPVRRDESPMTEGLEAKGWRSVINRDEVIDSDVGRIRISGVDDPFLKWQRTEHIKRAPDDDVAIALVHAPDVVSEWALNGFDVIFAGHTHAGQVRMPGLGAIVTNSSLPSALAGGLTRVGNCWLHVSPGLGHGRFSPIRFNARPEATLVTLRPST